LVTGVHLRNLDQVLLQMDLLEPDLSLLEGFWVGFLLVWVVRHPLVRVVVWLELLVTGRYRES
jgi:hypothetical protein